MLVITVVLSDGSQYTSHVPVSVRDVVAAIDPSLLRLALAAKVDDRLVDLSYIIDHDVKVDVITEKDKESLEIIRHSSAHLLAHAVKQLYPTTQVAIGPVIDNGFYYDFSVKYPFTPEDLRRIQMRMEELASQDIPIERLVIQRDEAVALFHNLGEQYKVKIINSISINENISLYRQADFIDLCRGPHVPSTGKLKAFRLMKLAGAYWRGDSRNDMLQRVYGTAWVDLSSLESYLYRLEESEKRDHRKVGKALDLFHFQEEAPGMVFWHDHGWRVYIEIQNYIRHLLRENGYKEVHTPQIVARSLWERSGHWEKFHKDMFTTASENRDYAIKPMNCPCHIQVYNQRLRSYRELPLRLSEFGSCHRNETSGTLHGLMRVRNFVQDDAHIFCTEDQIQSEVSRFMDLLFRIYNDFNFDEVQLVLSTRPEQRVGSDAVWDKAEKSLELALNQRGLPWQLKPGEGAFYGPKIEFVLRDCLERLWQCGTIQIDFSMPSRLDACYIAEDGSRQIPVMLHRAILGSLERFIGILIEQYAAGLPVWLAPVQVVVLNITEQQAGYAVEVEKSLVLGGFRVESDLRNEKISFKIRIHTLQRVPYMLIVGNREMETETVAIRSRDGKDLGVMNIQAFVQVLQSDVARRGRTG
jgi:threonyl-tRNA synthetase